METRDDSYDSPRFSMAMERLEQSLTISVAPRLWQNGAVSRLPSYLIARMERNLRIAGVRMEAISQALGRAGRRISRIRQDHFDLGRGA